MPRIDPLLILRIHHNCKSLYFSTALPPPFGVSSDPTTRGQIDSSHVDQYIKKNGVAIQLYTGRLLSTFVSLLVDT